MLATACASQVQQALSVWDAGDETSAARIDHSAYSMETIRDIHRGWLDRWVPLGSWDDVHVRVAGHEPTLNTSSNTTARAPCDRTAGFTMRLTAPATGSPICFRRHSLRPSTEALLDAGTWAYVNNPRGVTVIDFNNVVLASIYDSYVEDLGGTEAVVVAHFPRVCRAPLVARLRILDGAIKYAYRLAAEPILKRPPHRRGQRPGATGCW